MIPGHQLERKLRDVPEREVWEGHFGGVRCVTRILRVRAMAPGFARALSTAVVEGRGSFAALGDDIAMTVEGYGVAARLMRDGGDPPRWPRALAAGLTDAGQPFITTAWIEGTPLHELQRSLAPEAADAALSSLVATLVELHARQVAFGDLKLANLVLRPDGGLALIDLDTVREVPAADGGAPTRDRTPAWAAPEQIHAGQTWLASDVWALGRVLRRLFPEGAPPRWAEVLAAASHTDPLRRPTVASIAEHLAGRGALRDVNGTECVPWTESAHPGADGSAPAGSGGAAATERVGEGAPPLATERVPDSSTGPVPRADAPRGGGGAHPPPAPAPKARAGGGCAGAILSMGKVAAASLVALVLACCGGLGWWDRTQDARSDERAEALAVEMKAHKTDPARNGAGERERLGQAATALWDERPTRRTCAVRALATVWAQRWQSDTAWVQADYDEGSAAVSNPLCRDEVEVALARTTLHAGACRRRVEGGLSPTDCALALQDAADFWSRVPSGEAWNWMRVEAAWQEVRAQSALAGRGMELKNPEGEIAARAAVARCTEAEPWLAFAPVNGPELLDECMVVAGYLGNVEGYLHVTDLRLRSLPDPEHKTSRRRVLTSLYQSAGLGCRDTRVTFSKRGTLQAAGAPWCVALGHAARGCVEAAGQAAAEGALGDDQHPWAALTATFPSRTGPCLQ